MFRKVFLLVMSLLISLPGAGLANTSSQSSTGINLQANTSKLVNSEETANSLEYTEDYNGPVLESATITPKEAAVGDTVTITAKVTDDESGVGSVQAIFYGNSDKTVDLTYNNETGNWSGTYKIADYDHEGTWYLYFDMYDKAGNYSYGDTNESINVTNPNGDFDPAVIEKVTIDPQPVQAGEQVNVTAKVTDNLGIQSVKGNLFNPDGYYEGEVIFTYNSTADEWKGSSTIGANAYPGDWTLDVNVIDKAGNYSYDSSTFQVTNENGDYKGPVIGDVTVNQQVVNPGDELTVKADISDDKSGVDYAYTLLCSNDECYSYDLVKNPSTGLWETTISIPGYLKPGTYEIQIQASDKIGNYGEKTLEQTLEVHNDGDYTPPVVEDFQISTLTAKPNEEITFTASITDDQSGVGEVEVYLNSPSGQFRWLSLNYDDALGKWVGTYKVQSNDEPGTWTVEDRVSDMAGNGTWNNHGEITIDNPDADFTAPTLESFEVSPESAKVGETLTFKAKVSDTQSEVAQVFVDIYNTEFEHGQQIDLTYDHTSGYWVGTYTVDKTDSNGSYELSVFFEDTVGNNDWSYPQQTVTIENPDYDGTAPTFENIELSAAEVNFGEDLTITASLHDEQSGVREAYAYLTSPSGEGRIVDLTHNAELDKWVGTFTIGSREESGQWTVTELNFFDNYGNGNWESIGKT
ncbi:Ig-like domain repeat protein [Paenibacillus sp. BSR1-1]|uniref:Ig-like domain repeat protein n=1 Tax=Paenibacillus sp. BSR1-1 TaxID=3020845 RepID=UPI0025B10F16|nr:Ig-like domain repeat protein [Paenibacillus sp. BSR1-1]MDN3017989.1 Ig-like domain repeat protein [Paenibacillus sp. BSR1-1]